MDAEARATQAARDLWARGEYNAALPQFREAVKRGPNSASAIVNLGRAYALLRDYGRAADYVEKLIAKFPNDASALYDAGETYRLIGRYDEAAKCISRACVLTATPRRRAELANLLERRHQLAEAAEQAKLALTDDPNLVAAWIVQARVQRRRGDLSAAESSLRIAAKLAARDANQAAETWAELALVFDAAGDFDSAWSAIGRGKQFQIARDAGERRAAEHVLARFARLVDDITPEHFRRWQAASDRFPTIRTALLCGFPRTGTTLLEQVLDSHPGLVSSEEKDVLSMEIFPAIGAGQANDAAIAPILDAMSDAAIARHRLDYLRAMENMLCEPIGARVHLDKNPTLTLFLPVVLRLFPETRLLVALRDPRDVVLSCYLRFLPLNPVSVSFLTLERTVKRYTLDMLGWLKYREQIAAPWMEVRYENTVADLEGVARQALAHLDLPWDDDVLEYRERAASKPVLSPTYDAVAKPVYSTSVGRWRNYANHLEPVLSELEPYVREFGYE